MDDAVLRARGGASVTGSAPTTTGLAPQARRTRSALNNCRRYDETCTIRLGPAASRRSPTSGSSDSGIPSRTRRLSVTAFSDLLEPVGKWSRGLLILPFGCRRYGAGSAPSRRKRFAGCSWLLLQYQEPPLAPGTTRHRDQIATSCHPGVNTTNSICQQALRLRLPVPLGL